RTRRGPPRLRAERLGRSDRGTGAGLRRTGAHPARAGAPRRRGCPATANVTAIAGAAVVGFLAGRLTWVLVAPVVTTPLTMRPNWRGREVVTAAGGVLPLTALLVAD